MEEDREKKDQPNQDHTINWKDILIIITTIAMCMLLLNQATGWYMRSKILTQPCVVCAKLNPHLEECFNVPHIIIDDQEIDWFGNYNMSNNS